MAHDVFISYASNDKKIADAVCGRLEATGIRCWIAPRDITPGSDWSAAIVGAIENSHVLILVFSAHANDSEQIKREVERAVHRGNAVIPFRVEDIQPSRSLEYFISTAHWLDAITPPVEQHIDRLGSAVKELIRSPDVENRQEKDNTQTAEPPAKFQTKKPFRLLAVIAGSLVFAGIFVFALVIISSSHNGRPLSHADVDTLTPISKDTTQDESNQSNSALSPESRNSRLDKLTASPSLGVANTLENLAVLYEAQGQYKDAESIWQRVLAMREKLVGKKHPEYAQTLQSIAKRHIRMGRPDLAVGPQMEAVEIFTAVYGHDHPETATSLNALAGIYLEMAEYKKAAPLIEQALKIRTSSLGEDHPDLIPILENLVRVYNLSGDNQKATAVGERLEALKKRFNKENE